MFAMEVMTLLCVAGIAFSVRFLVALCQEQPPHRIDYWVRLQLGSASDPLDEEQQQEQPVTRAA